jgi:photosystem II stability/assembly factor-like uncharacterized protein
MAAIKISFITWLLISFTFVSYSQSGWTVCFQNSGYSFYSVDFVNHDTGYVLDVGGRVLKTTNAGLNWVEISNYLGDVIDIDFVNEQTGFICGDTYCSILKTTNGGYNWQVKALYNQYMYDIDFIDSDIGFAVGEGGYIVKTTNSGNNWVQLVSPPNSSFYSISIVNSLTMFVSGNKIIKTTNGGMNWIDITPGSSNITSFFSSIYFVNKDSGCEAGFNGIITTTNSGETWIIFTGSISYHDIVFANSTSGYVCGDNGTILKTTNNGLNWHSQFVNVNVRLTGFFFIDLSTGYCVSSDGVILKTTNGGEPIGIQPISNEIPNAFSLSQNYPNPFNPSTRIKFSIPPSRGDRGVTVLLIIYDVLGREIAVLLNENLSSGTYETEWSAVGGASNYPSGVYFYKLIAGDYTATKKMVLIK